MNFFAITTLESLKYTESLKSLAIYTNPFSQIIAIECRISDTVLTFMYAYIDVGAIYIEQQSKWQKFNIYDKLLK